MIRASATNEMNVANQRVKISCNKLKYSFFNRMMLEKASDIPNTISELYELWALERHERGASFVTTHEWKIHLHRFSDATGLEQIQSITSKVARAYIKALYTEHTRHGGSPKSVRDGALACLRSVFSFAVREGWLGENPFKGVDVPVSGIKLQKAPMRAFSDGQAAAILKAAARETDPLIRWVPLICAFTGARVSTVINLRPCDVISVDGRYCLSFSPDAGPIKTAASIRIVPLHQSILDAGFLAFVNAVQRERLFIAHYGTQTSTARRDPETGLPHNPARCVRNKLNQWLRQLGIGIGRANGIDPNHAWRHWFRERAYEADIPEKIIDAIVGHAQKGQGRRYGQVSVAEMARHLARIEMPRQQ